MWVWPQGRDNLPEKEMATLPVFLPGKSHGQSGLVSLVHGIAKSWTRLSAGAHVHCCWCAVMRQISLLWFGCRRVEMKVLVTPSCWTLWDPMDWSPPGSSVHGRLQARILGSVTIPFARGFSQPRDQKQVCTAGSSLWSEPSGTTPDGHRLPLKSVTIYPVLIWGEVRVWKEGQTWIPRKGCSSFPWVALLGLDSSMLG